MKKARWMILCGLVLCLAGCVSPSRTENGVVIDDGKSSNYLDWLKNNM